MQADQGYSSAVQCCLARARLWAQSPEPPIKCQCTQASVTICKVMFKDNLWTEHKTDWVLLFCGSRDRRIATVLIPLPQRPDWCCSCTRVTAKHFFAPCWWQWGLRTKLLESKLKGDLLGELQAKDLVADCTNAHLRLSRPLSMSTACLCAGPSVAFLKCDLPEWVT